MMRWIMRLAEWFRRPRRVCVQCRGCPVTTIEDLKAGAEKLTGAIAAHLAALEIEDQAEEEMERANAEFAEADLAENVARQDLTAANGEFSKLIDGLRPIPVPAG